MGDDGFANVGLPNAHSAGAVRGNAAGIHQTRVNGKGPGGGGEVAAVAAPVDKIFVDGDLAVEVVHIVAGARALAHDHALAGAGGGAAHAVNVRAIGVGAANHTLQQSVARRAGLLRGFGQVLQAKKHALAGAAAHIGGGDLDLG